MTLDQAVEYVQRTGAEPTGTAPWVVTLLPRAGSHDPLTARERAVALIGRGLTSREIANALVSAEATADTHAARIRQKLRLRSQAEIAAWAVEHRLRSEQRIPSSAQS